MDGRRYTVRIELDTRDDLAVDLVRALAGYAPSVGRGPRGRAEVRVTLPADDVVQATQTAVAVVAHALTSAGHVTPVLGVEVLPADEHDRRASVDPVPTLVSVADAAAVLGVSRQAVQQRIESGSLPATRVGRTYAIRRSDLTVTPRSAPRRASLAAAVEGWEGVGRWPGDDAPAPRDSGPNLFDPMPMPPNVGIPGGGGL
jgi:excisionase family DNA binding protein